MTVDEENAGPAPPDAGSPVAQARSLVRGALKAALATLDTGSGHPYGSLVTVATEPDGTPLLLLSRLARHTRNLSADPRASLLFDGTGGTEDPLAGPRVTLVCRCREASSPTARRRFLARHPHAALYADFPDFRFYAAEVDSGHLVAGFGRIVDISAADLLTTVRDAEALVAAESDILAHMNADHREALALCVSAFAGAARASAGLRMTGIDPDGFDVADATQAWRFAFEVRVRTPVEAREQLVRLAAAARERLGRG
jgi:putative heme iron utilization protein